MRLAILAVLAIGCGGHERRAVTPPAQAAAFPAARWVPARPAYVFASRTVDDAQRSLRDMLDVLGTLTGYDLGDVTSALEGLLGVDPLHPDPVAAIGVDPHGSWAMFSEQLSPTIVVHLGAPDRMAAFLDKQRQRGVVAQPVTVDNTQVFSAALGPVTLSWAIDGDWMWIHDLPWLVVLKTTSPAGITELIGKLRGWYEAYSPGATLTVENKPFAVTPHLVCAHQATSTFYALISDSGKALFLDYGAAGGNFINSFTTATPVNDRIRFVEHTIPDLKARYGLKSVDVVMPSHMHDDHLNGFPHLVRHHGAKVW